MLDNWSVRRLKEAGADCVKVLLYYTPTDGQAINDKKHAWVERIGDECRANDIPYFLEFVGYDEGVDEKGLEFAKKKPEIVIGSMAEFTKDKYGIDVMKVEVPVNMKFVEGAKSYAGQKAYSKTEAMDHFRKASAVATKPFIYLSAGVSNAEFNEGLALAAEAGVKFNGVLCGRATWKDGIPVYAKQGAKAFEQWLQTEGVKNIENVNTSLKAATSWFAKYECANPRWRIDPSLNVLPMSGPEIALLSLLERRSFSSIRVCSTANSGKQAACELRYPAPQRWLYSISIGLQLLLRCHCLPVSPAPRSAPQCSG